MAKTEQSGKALSKIEDLRSKAVEKFFSLSEKMIKHITWSMEATVPCVSCSVDKDGKHQPGKAKDTMGLCAMCHGTYMVPDKQQRNWAIEQAQPVIAPAPKTVEMSIERESSLPELEKEAAKLSDEELNRRVSIVAFGQAVGNALKERGVE